MRYFAHRQMELTPIANANILSKDVTKCVELRVCVGVDSQLPPQLYLIVCKMDLIIVNFYFLRWPSLNELSRNANQLYT